MTGYALKLEAQEEQEQFGAWLKAERERLRLTRAGVARDAEISEQQLYRIEIGETGSKRETLRAIARAMRLDEGEVLERAGFSARGAGIAESWTVPGPVQNDPNAFFDPRDAGFAPDDPILVSIIAHYEGSPAELRPKMLGEIARIVREHQREQTDFGKKAEEE